MTLNGLSRWSPRELCIPVNVCIINYFLYGLLQRTEEYNVSKAFSKIAYYF